MGNSIGRNQEPSKKKLRGFTLITSWTQVMLFALAMLTKTCHEPKTATPHIDINIHESRKDTLVIMKDTPGH